MTIHFSNYTSLAAESKQIRLLRIHKRDGNPREKDEIVISCTFSIVSLDEFPEYEALSYVWGDPSKAKTIRINNEPVGITKNLYEALLELRCPDRERTLWADAVCINQRDDVERTHQVSIMHDIFQRAAKVVIYLGPSWEGCVEAFEFFEATGRDSDLHIADYREPCVAINGVRGFTPELRRYLIQFLSLPWWTRLWTVQEVVLAKSADMHCGLHVMSGDVLFESLGNIFRHVLTCCVDKGVRTRESDLIWTSLIRLESINIRRNWSNAFSIFHLFSTFRIRQAHDPRDKIFGLLGLASEQYLGAIVPDYTRSTEEIYREVVITCVSITGTLEFLSHCYGQRALDLPSFIPDWTALVGENTNANYANRTQIISYHDASDGAAAEVDFTAFPKASFMGLIYDTMTRTGSSPITGRITEEALQSWREYAGVERTVEKSTSDVTEAEIGFAATLCGGMGSDWKEGGNFLRRASLEEDWHRFTKWEAWIASNYDHAVTFDDDVSLFNTTMVTATLDRRLVKTSNDHLALVPDATEEGDVIAILAGGKVPYVLRPSQLEDSDGGPCQLYTFIGDAYLYGIMDGEAWPEDNSDLSKIRMM